MNYFLTVLMNCMSNGSTAIQKQYGRLVKQRKQSMSLYMVIHSVCAIVFYAFTSAGELTGSMRDVIFGFVYSVISSVSLVISLLAYKKMDLIVLTVFTKANVVTSWLIGILLFDEEIKFTNILAVLFIVITVIAPLFNKEKDGRIKMSLSSYLIGLMLIFVGFASTLLIQVYVKIPETNNQSMSVMCFYTNFFMLFVTMTHFLLSTQKSKNGMGVIGEIKAVKPAYFLLPPAISILQTSSTLLQAYILKSMPLSVFMIFGTGVSSVLLYLISRFIFRERPDRLMAVMWMISTLAALLTIF